MAAAAGGGGAQPRHPGLAWGGGWGAEDVWICQCLTGIAGVKLISRPSMHHRAPTAADLTELRDAAQGSRGGGGGGGGGTAGAMTFHFVDEAVMAKLDAAVLHDGAGGMSGSPSGPRPCVAAEHKIAKRRV